MVYITRFTLVFCLFVLATQLPGCGGGGGGGGSSQPALPIRVSVTPNVALVPAGTTQVLSATVLNDSAQRGVTWAISPASGAGTLSNDTSTSVTYSAPSSPPPSDVAVTITAKSISNDTISASAVVTLPASIVTIDPGAAYVPAGGSQDLTATVLYDPGQTGVTWEISPASGAGTLSNGTSTSVTYNAPADAPPSDVAVTITATSITDANVKASATITIPAIVVTVAPHSALIPVNGVQTYSATTYNDPTNLGVTWSLSQGAAACTPACGTITATDTTTASYSGPDAIPGDRSVTVAATSVADVTKIGTAAISIATGTVQLAPADLRFGPISKTSTQVKHVTLTNLGGAALDISDISISGTNSTKFLETSTCTPSVAAGASCDIAVTFKPKAAGTFSATLAIKDSSTDSPQQVPLSGIARNSASSFDAVQSVLSSVKRVAIPAPTGPHSVGTRVVELVDAAREDPYLADGSKRRLLLRFWYPASVGNGCKSAPYSDAKVWSYFSELLGVRLPSVQTNSCLQARVLDGAYPVVIFSHGFTGTFTDYSFLFEDLASRGYIVASVDHTYEATAVAFPDGHMVKSVLGSHLDRNMRTDEQTLSAAETVRLGDIQFVLDELPRLNSDRRSPFAGHLDTASIAIAGHSLGGLTALQALQQDARIRAAVLLDGIVPDATIEATDKPVLVLDAGRTQWSDDERRLWSRLQGPRYAVNLRNAEHVAPSDAVWLARGAIQTGSMSPEKTVAAVRAYVAAFLDANLQGRPVDALLARPSDMYIGAEVGGPHIE